MASIDWHTVNVIDQHLYLPYQARNKEKELAALLEVLEKQLGIRQDIVK